MRNLRIVSNNAVQAATLTASSEAGAMVVENLQLESKTKVWRGQSTTQSITATFTSQIISFAGLIICNLTSTATMRVRIYTLIGSGTPAYDSGNVLCCEYTTINKIDFGDGPLNSNTFSYGGGTYASVFTTATAGEKVVIDIIDSANTNGYVESCGLVIGEYWEPENNAAYGAALSFLDTSKHSRNDSGDLMTNRGARYKKLVFTLSQMQAADRTELTEILIRNGMSIPLYISIYPESTDEQLKQIYQVYGKLTKLGAISHFAFGLDKSAVNVEET